MLYVVVESYLVWVDELVPRVLSLKQTFSFLILVNSAETVFIDVGHLVLGLLLDSPHLCQVDIVSWSLPHELL